MTLQLWLKGALQEILYENCWITAPLDEEDNNEKRYGWGGAEKKKEN